MILTDSFEVDDVGFVVGFVVVGEFSEVVDSGLIVGYLGHVDELHDHTLVGLYVSEHFLMVWHLTDSTVQSKFFMMSYLLIH